MESEVKQNSHEVLQNIGTKLREERMRQDLSISDVSARLRIMEDHLRNIENAEVDQLPTHAYIIGYVRSCATMLGLDAATLCAELRASLTNNEKNPDFNFVENKVTSRAGNGRVALVALVAGFLIYGGWYTFSTGLIGGNSATVEVAQTAPDTTRPSATSSGEAPDVTLDVASDVTLDAASDVAQDGAADEPAFTAVEPRVDTAVTSPEPTAEDGAVKLDDSSLEKTADAATGSGGTASGAATAPLTGEQIVEAPAAEPVTRVTEAQAISRVPGREITLKATSSSWVKVTRADGSEVTAKLMREGDVYVVPSGEDLYLTTGNAGGLDLTLGEDAPITLGSWGETLSELPLDETAINQRY